MNVDLTGKVALVTGAARGIGLVVAEQLAHEGVIIFVSSDAGKKGGMGSSAYSASKFGVTGFAESVAKDLKYTKIRSSAIMPGMTWTPMAEESEYADLDMDWLDSLVVANAILFCIKQDVNTVIPELQIYHRSQI